MSDRPVSYPVQNGRVLVDNLSAGQLLEERGDIHLSMRCNTRKKTVWGPGHRDTP